MLKRLILAALLCAAPALAGPAGDTLKDALYAGTLADGLAKLQPMAAGGDTEAAFGVGTIKLTQTLEHFAQALYRHGFDLPDGRAAGVVGPAIPQNPNPEPFDYNGVRDMLQAILRRKPPEGAAA